MDKPKRDEFIKSFVGKTISEVYINYLNTITLVFTDGSRMVLEASGEDVTDILFAYPG